MLKISYRAKKNVVIIEMLVLLVLFCNCEWYCSLLNILEIVAPFKQFGKLREFLLNKLPPGFPVKIGKQVIYLFMFF